MAWKYVVVRVGNRMEVPVIFPTHMVHSEMVDMIKVYYANEANNLTGGLLALSEHGLHGVMEAVVPVSAGETVITVESCSGGSETLKLKARPIDRSLLGSYDYTGGVLNYDTDG